MIINWLARRRWGRMALIPVVIWCGAWSWFDYLDGTSNVQDKGRLKDRWGWLSDAMLPEWRRLSDPSHPDYGSWFHSVKNIGSEWARQDVQRAYKAMSFLLVSSIIVLAAVGIGAALLIPWLR